jgi:hypothetical protein
VAKARQAITVSGSSKNQANIFRKEYVNKNNYFIFDSAYLDGENNRDYISRR